MVVDQTHFSELQYASLVRLGCASGLLSKGYHGAIMAPDGKAGLEYTYDTQRRELKLERAMLFMSNGHLVSIRKGMVTKVTKEGRWGLSITLDKGPGVFESVVLEAEPIAAQDSEPSTMFPGAMFFPLLEMEKSGEDFMPKDSFLPVCYHNGAHSDFREKSQELLKVLRSLSDQVFLAYDRSIENVVRGAMLDSSSDDEQIKLWKLRYRLHMTLMPLAPHVEVAMHNDHVVFQDLRGSLTAVFKSAHRICSANEQLKTHLNDCVNALEKLKPGSLSKDTFDRASEAIGTLSRTVKDF